MATRPRLMPPMRRTSERTNLAATRTDAELEPELVGGDSGTEDLGESEGVGEEESEDDGPEDVLDLREVVVVRAEEDAERLEAFAGEADGEEQKRSGNEREELMRSRWLASGCGRRDGGGGQKASG